MRFQAQAASHKGGAHPLGRGLVMWLPYNSNTAVERERPMVEW